MHSVNLADYTLQVNIAKRIKQYLRNTTWQILMGELAAQAAVSMCSFGLWAMRHCALSMHVAGQFCCIGRRFRRKALRFLLVSHKPQL